MTGLGLGWNILIICIVLFIILMIIGNNVEKNEAKKAIALLNKIEVTYDKYITQKIVNSIVETNSLEPDLDKFINEALSIIKPEIEGLINQINASIYTAVEIEYDSPYFSNIVSLVQRYFDTSQKNEDKKLTKEEVDNMYEGFRVAMTADIKKRLLEY